VPTLDRLRINHYRIKWLDDYEGRMFKGVVEADSTKWKKRPLAMVDRNEVEDRTLLRYEQALRSALAA